MSISFQRRVFIFIFLLTVCANQVLRAQQPMVPTNTTASTNSPAEQIAALQLELTNAWHHVETIVNQPVPAYRREQGYHVSIYSPDWFHPGATIPDFNTVDVRQSQQLIYTSQYVSSDVSPGMMFMGRDLEFNAMTKLFYTNRMLPKKRLTEAEMEEINSLYRVIGRCQNEIAKLQEPRSMESAAADETESSTNEIAPGQPLAAIRSIPREKRIFYGGIAIGALFVLLVVSQFFKKRRVKNRSAF